MSTSQTSAGTTSTTSTVAGEAAVMRTERERASFPVRELTYLLHGGRERTETKERVAAIYEKDPKLRWDDRYFLSREANFEKMLSQVAHTLRLVKELNITDPVELYYFRYFLNSHNFTGTHWSMFVETLEGQGTEEQKAQWLDAAKRYHILGCYAQTELGHGSNVRGLETTATYDKQRQEFVLNSPTLTSTKWWPGGLGLVGTHAVTHARLIIDGKDHGVHAFVVQLRNLEDHKPLPGITVGDIGPKMGFNQNDNGFLRFDHVRIPRGNMLAKYSSVTADGQYVKTPNVNPKIAYATMLYVRAHMVNEASEVLKRACTIAVRYSAVRRQFGGKSGAEKQVLDYQMQQYRLFGLLSKAFAFHFAGEHMISIYNDLTNSIKQKDLSKLPEVHATSAGLKAFTSWVAAAGTEEARKCCGGHGYSMASGLPSLFAEYVPACTYEGDNVILCLQTARYLLKALQQVQAGGKLKGGAKYLQDLSEQSQHSPIKSAEGFLCPHFQLHAHRHHARVVVVQAAQKVQAQLGQGKSFDDAWNASEVDLVRAVKAHCYLNIVEYFIQGVEQVENLHIRRVLKRLSDLFALQGIQEDIGEYLEDGYFSGQQVGTMRSVIESLLEEIRPDAVALVDSFNFPDFLLNSSLGRHDGNVYEHMYAWARSNPMNATPVMPGYEKHIKPFIQAGKASARL